MVSKSGEEDEEELYKHRAKVFRFDKDVNAWKERGKNKLNNQIQTKLHYHAGANIQIT